MKHIIAASTVLALLAGSASAANSQMHERHASFPNGVTATDTASVPASTVYSPKELNRADLKPTEIVTVTVVPTTENLSTRRHES
jgi:hypothetical protein